MHEAELRGFYADWQTAGVRIERFEKLLLPLARERVGAALASYRGGRGELGVVLEARRAETEARLGFVQSQLERARRLGKIEFPFAARGAAMSRALCLSAVSSWSPPPRGGGYWFAMSRAAQAGPHAMPGQDASGKRSSIGTTRWSRSSISTSRASRPSWTCQLVPKHAEETSGEAPWSSIRASRRTSACARRRRRTGSVERRIEAVGSVAWNERAVFVVQARSGGFVEKLYARAPLDRSPKASRWSSCSCPDWAAAQAEYLLLQRGGKDSGLAEARATGCSCSA